MNLEERIQQSRDKIALSQKGLQEASERASDFLITQAYIADEIKSCREDEARLQTLVDGAFHDAFKSCSGNTTEKRSAAQTDEIYSDYREKLEDCQARISWLKTYLSIFDNAHITYRQHSKEQ